MNALHVYQYLFRLQSLPCLKFLIPEFETWVLFLEWVEIYSSE